MPDIVIFCRKAILNYDVMVMISICVRQKPFRNPSKQYNTIAFHVRQKSAEALLVVLTSRKKQQAFSPV
jgi:hypothetical protein